MEFKNFEALIQRIESDLGSDFNNRFRLIRKRLNKKKKLPNRQILTRFDKNKSEWVYNDGGKKEIQYHLFYRDNKLGYGLGINSQRGSFNNENPVRAANLLGSSFIKNYQVIKRILPHYDFEIGSYEQLGNMKEEEFILFGNHVNLSTSNVIDDSDYELIISDLGNQLKAYSLIFETNNKLKIQEDLRQSRLGEIENLSQLLISKKQIILQGPPGTGKTRLAKEIAHQLIFDKQAATDDEQKVALSSSEQFEIVQFHASYSYEDFVRGIAVETTEKGNVVYTVKNRILAQMAQNAIDNEGNNYVLIIDEINRANLSSVLGELIYALEYRGETVESLYELKGKGREIVLPSNLFIIGTMNTADRSVGHIDYAIRRRFAFESVLPQDLTGTLESGYAFAKAEFDKVKALFVNDINLKWDDSELKNSEHLSEEFDPKDVCIGHSYFIHKDDEDFTQRLQYEIKPILDEYIKDGVLKGSDALRTALNNL